MPRVSTWTELYCCVDVNSALTVLKNKLLPLVNKHAPYKILNCREKSAPWVTNELLSFIDEKIFRCRKFKRKPNAGNELLKKEAIKRVSQLKRHLQRTYINNQLEECEGDSRKLWRCLKTFLAH